MINDAGGTYGYDAEGRITTIGGGNPAYVYDAFGRRIGDTGAGLVFLYDQAGRRITSVTTSGADDAHEIYAGSRLLAVHGYAGLFGKMTWFYHSDQLGTDRVITYSGSVAETCTSLPYGDGQSCTTQGFGSPPARYASYFMDDAAGLDYAPARYYSPSLGRFMTPDPFGTPPARGTCSAGGAPSDATTSPLARPQSLNRYVYVVDSPATAEDPSGNFILAADCFPDVGLLPECLCDPENGCPPVLLLLPPLGLGTAAPTTSRDPCTKAAPLPSNSPSRDSYGDEAYLDILRAESWCK